MKTTYETLDELIKELSEKWLEIVRNTHSPNANTEYLEGRLSGLDLAIKRLKEKRNEYEN